MVAEQLLEGRDIPRLDGPNGLLSEGGCGGEPKQWAESGQSARGLTAPHKLRPEARPRKRLDYLTPEECYEPAA